MPNLIAFIALILWPFASLWLFRTRPLNRAILWTVLGAMLLLPVGTGIKLVPGIPALDKNSAASFGLMLGLAAAGRRSPAPRPRFGITEILLYIYILGPFITCLLNGDPVFTGRVIINGVSYYDGLGLLETQFLFIFPFIVGRRYLRGPADTEEVLRILTIAALIYTVPMLMEIRLSPQLHNWIYGYFPSEFLQSMREGGFRPVVFLGHGLLVAFFMTTAVLAATALWRTRQRVTPAAASAAALYLGFILILCKSLGALVYALALAPMIKYTRPVFQLRVALLLACMTLAYPVLRMEGWFPTKALVGFANDRSADRAGSLEFRFDNEDRLLTRASERFWFGWGGWGRSRVYDNTGNDISVTDGRWIITLGWFGILGFIAEFGLLALPVFRALSAKRFITINQEAVHVAALALILAAGMVDLLPNASISPWSWLLAGALLGRAEEARIRGRVPKQRLEQRPDLSPEMQPAMISRTFETGRGRRLG